MMKRISLTIVVLLALVGLYWPMKTVAQITTEGWSFASNRDAILTMQEPVPGATTASLVATGTGNCTAGTHLFRTTVVTAAGESTAGAASASVTCDGTHKQVTVTIPTGSPFVTGRNVYATKAGASTYYRVAASPVVNNNTSTSYTFNIADGSFTSTTIPSSSTARDVRLRVNATTGVITPGTLGYFQIAQMLISGQTIGDLIYASSATAWSRLAAVASGQVLVSAGTGTAPAYSANPSVTSLTVKGGAGTGTIKASGVICSSAAGTCGCTALTDAATQNTWNVMTCTLPASTLNAAGDSLFIDFMLKAAANTNAKEIQAYFNGATCSGTNATMCASGTQLTSLGSSTAGINVQIKSRIHKVGAAGANTQLADSLSYMATAVSDNVTLNATATESGTILIAFGIRNTAASAASVQNTPNMVVRYGAGQ